jgi:DnaJ-class molecular chaperone
MEFKIYCEGCSGTGKIELENVLVPVQCGNCSGNGYTTHTIEELLN